MPKSVLFDREAVINNVIKLFWAKGYDATSMQDLVDATGLNRSSIYNSFGDKFQLFMEALSHYRLHQANQIEELIKSGKSPKQALKTLFMNIKESVEDSKNNYGCFITKCTSELSTNPEVKRVLEDNKVQMIELFEKLLIEAQKSGEIKSDKDMRSLALYLFSNLQGLRVTSLLLHDSADIEGVTDHIFDSL